MCDDVKKNNKFTPIPRTVESRLLYIIMHKHAYLHKHIETLLT